MGNLVIGFWLTVIGWFLRPIVSLLVNKIFVFFVFDASKKLKELENETIPKLKQTLGVVEEQTVLRAAKDKESQSNLKILDRMKMDLKSALYEAEDILDLLDYRRIEKDLHGGDDDDSRWVENQLGVACAWIARCKGSSFGRWIHVTLAAVMKRGQNKIRQGQLVIQGWRHSGQNFDLFSICRAINNARAAVLQFAQSLYQQLGRVFRSVTLRRSVVLLPVSAKASPQPTCLESRGSESVPAEEMVDEKETQVLEQEAEIEEMEEIEDGEEGEMPEETEEGCGEVGQTSEEEIEEESCEGGNEGETSEEETSEEDDEEETSEEDDEEETSEEDDEEGKEDESTSLSLLWYCARSILTWFAKACFYRDWSYGILGIRSNKKDASAVHSLVPIIERISLKNQIKRIEDILITSKKSDLLNDTNSSSSTPKDGGKESSSSCTVKNSAEESTSTQKEIDDLYRRIEKEVFGRDNDREHICRMLREGPDTNAASSSTSKPYSVIGIYGITGSGKSTLAQYVCDYEMVAGHFNLIMFILVGQTFSICDIFREMLDQIKQPGTNDLKSLKTEIKDLPSLRAELEKELKDKCFLLILDDLRVNGGKWKEHGILLDVLRVGRSGSRILVTAQKKDAVAALGAQEKMQIPIPDLEEGQYLSMFMHYALEDSHVTGTDYHRYKEIARKIVKKLGRSPIAARTVAARLKSNNNTNFWETTANLDVLNETMGALWWSYQQLGGDIRRCFTYCRNCPKGYEIKRDELVPLWIAQGFVNIRNNATEELEAIGQSYFDQLLAFSFLQVHRTIFGRETGAFTIHDLLHELAERVSGSEFYRIDLSGLPKDIPRGVHHLYIKTNNAAEIAEKILDLGNLRTLIIKEPYAWSMKTMKRNHDLEKHLERLFMRLTKLRVLIIKLNNDIEELSVPASIDQMKHLRYLGIHICGSPNLILPSTFSKLYHIQIVNIPRNVASCLEDMGNLIYLGYFSAPLSFPNIGRLTALQTLIKFEVKEEPGHELKQLMHLNSLRDTLFITGLVFVGCKDEAAEGQLTHKKQLRILKLDFNSAKRVDPDVEAEVLEGLCPPTDIQELGIRCYMGSKYPSWMLSCHHPDAPKQLHTLELCSCSQLASIPEGSELLTGLRKLIIFGCYWDSWPENIERMVSLQTLEIMYCKEMEHLPMLPQALKTIEISACDKLRSIGIMDDCPRLEFKLEKEKRLEACTSEEYCQDTAPTGTPEQSPYPMICCPCLVTLEIRVCDNLVTLPNLPPSLKSLIIRMCGELCSVSGQLDQLEKLDIYMCNKLRSVDSLGDASSLETLSLSCCRSLAFLGSDGGPGSYLALQELRIKYCSAMDMKQFNKNVLNRFGYKEISHAISSNTDERA